MRRVLEELERLRASLLVVAQARTSDADPTAKALVEPYIRAIGRKCAIVIIHQAMLNDVDWDGVDDIGRQVSLDGRCKEMTINLSQTMMTIRSTVAAKDQIYIAFDGLVTGVVNVTDTLARLVNACYRLNIEERRATLFSVRDKIRTSPLGILLNEASLTAWLPKLRDLRGRCQHADLEDVLVNQGNVFGRSSEPYVPGMYDWSEASVGKSITEYAAASIEGAESLMCDCVAAIVKHGDAACRSL